MEGLQQAFQLVQSPDSALRVQGEAYLAHCTSALVFQSIWQLPASALQAALFLKVQKPNIAAELRTVLFEGRVQGKVRAVLEELFAELCYQQWPGNYTDMEEILVSVPVQSLHLALFQALKKDKSTRFYQICEAISQKTAPFLHSSVETDTLYSNSAKYTSKLPLDTYTFVLSAISASAEASNHWKSLLLKRIRLYPQDLIGLYEQLVDLLLVKLSQEPIFALRGLTAILNSPLFSPAGLLLLDEPTTLPCPIQAKLSSERILEIVTFVLTNYIALSGKETETAAEMVGNEEFESKKYDLRPCAAAFLSALYANSAPQLQLALKTACLGLLLTPIVPTSPPALLLQKEAVLYSLSTAFHSTPEAESLLSQLCSDLACAPQ